MVHLLHLPHFFSFLTLKVRKCRVQISSKHCNRHTLQCLTRTESCYLVLKWKCILADYDPIGRVESNFSHSSEKQSCFVVNRLLNMESFVSKHPIALTIIFSYVISPSRCDVQNGSCSFLTNFISLNRSILEAFDVNDAFWMWFIKYTFDCKTCIEDIILLRSVTAQMIPNVNEKFCFWKRECKVQMATRRLRRQWSLKFAGRVLTHNYVPIIWESDSSRQLTVFRSSKTNASGKAKQEGKGKAAVTAAATMASPAGQLDQNLLDKLPSDTHFQFQFQTQFQYNWINKSIRLIET